MHDDDDRSLEMLGGILFILIAVAVVSMTVLLVFYWGSML